MNAKKMIVVSVLLVVTFVVSGQFAWAGSMIKFINNSSKDVEVKIQTMMPGGTTPDNPDVFTLAKNSTRDYTTLSPCIKGLWLNNVQKLFFPDDPNPTFRCLNLAIVSLIITIKADGNSEISQQ